jgi:hypothetical protein
MNRLRRILERLIEDTPERGDQPPIAVIHLYRRSDWMIRRQPLAG